MAKPARKGNGPPDPADYNDPVFFHKSQLSVGGTLVYHGRRDPGRRWRIQSILSHDWVRGGEYREIEIPTVKYLSDRITIATTTAPRESRTLHFGALSYSAIWRLLK